METKGRHLEGDTLCDYAEGALDAHAHAAAEAHLRNCPDCLRELQVVRAYFREMTGLEAAKAPANFLADVRARLPQPSPWKAFLLGFMRPVRAIPMQIAVLTVLGITVITAYLYERGGRLSEAPALIPLTASAKEAAGSGEPAEAVQDEAAAGNETDGREEDGKSPPTKAMESMRSALSAKKQGYSEPELANRKAKPMASSAPGSAAREPVVASAPAPTLASVPYAAFAPSGAQPSGSTETYAGKASSEEKKESSDSPGTLASVKQASLHAINLQLRKAGEGPTLLAGLQAMGVEVVPHSDGGPIWYWLQVPASRVAELKPYLERYGTLGRQDGPLPARAAAPLSFDLRVAPPPK
ncbi:MAG: hypothetical protein ABI036_18245 [Fibrobacteria bacterium]